MAYEYGSTDLGIRNPFKFEGFVRTLGGAVVAALGLFCLFRVRALTAGGEQLEGWLTMAMGVGLLGAGFYAMGLGIFQFMRFFVGRGVPTSLATNHAKSEAHVKQHENPAYSDEQLEQMLQGRKNITFEEPRSWLARLVHSIFPALMFLPFGYRNLAQTLVKGLSQTLIALLCYALAWFSGVSGLTTIQGTPVMAWLGVLLFGYLALVWIPKRKALPRTLRQRKTDATSAKGLVVAIAAAVVLPVGLVYLHTQVTPLPALPFSFAGFVFGTLVLAIVNTLFVVLLLRERVSGIRPLTEVSELRDNWQESIHPQEMFIHFENIVMANRRYLEVPNRVYRLFDPRLIEQGSNDKGSFRGEVIQEVQPRFIPRQHSPAMQALHYAGTVLARLLLVASAFVLYAGIDEIAAAIQVVGQSGAMAALGTAAQWSLSAFLLALFGIALSNYMHLFWAEMQFESTLVYFQCHGTYTESKISTGTSIYDSTRSENVVVRSSMVPWILVSRVVTSVFAASGARNLEYERVILEMHKDDATLKDIEQDIQHFMKQRHTIAGITNEGDLNAAARIHQINQQSRHDPHGSQQPLLDNDRAREYQGELGRD